MDAGIEATIRAPLIVSASPWRAMVALAPFAMPSDCPSLRLAAVSEDVVTWYFRISRSWSAFSGSSRLSSVPGGSASKPALVGAKTVRGPDAATAVT